MSPGKTMKTTKTTKTVEPSAAANVVIFMQVRALPAWLALPRERRNAISQGLSPVLGRYPDVAMRYFDAEAFTSRCSDVLMFECSDIERYHFLIEELRDSVMFAHPYFELTDVVTTIEEGFRRFERSSGALL